MGSVAPSVAVFRQLVHARIPLCAHGYLRMQTCRGPVGGSCLTFTRLQTNMFGRLGTGVSTTRDNTQAPPAFFNAPVLG